MTTQSQTGNHSKLRAIIRFLLATIITALVSVTLVTLTLPLAMSFSDSQKPLSLLFKEAIDILPVALVMGPLVSAPLIALAAWFVTVLAKINPFWQKPVGWFIAGMIAILPLSLALFGEEPLAEWALLMAWFSIAGGIGALVFRKIWLQGNNNL